MWCVCKPTADLDFLSKVTAFFEPTIKFCKSSPKSRVRKNKNHHKPLLKSSSPKPLKPYSAPQQNHREKGKKKRKNQLFLRLHHQEVKRCSIPAEKWRAFYPKPPKRSSPRKPSATPPNSPSAASLSRSASAAPSRSTCEVHIFPDTSQTRRRMRTLIRICNKCLIGCFAYGVCRARGAAREEEGAEALGVAQRNQGRQLAAGDNVV